MSFSLSAINNEELIHNATRHGHVISLEVYLNQNPKSIDKIFTYDRSKWTPLLAACFYKHEHIVRMLLNRFEPDVEAVGTITVKSIDNRSDLAEEVSPLWTAAAVNDFELVKLLVERGHANVNHLIKTHSTPLRAACFHNNLNMVQYLVEHGANPYQAKKGNFTNLMLSAGHQYSSMVRYLVDELQCDVNDQDENGQTALYYAVRSGSIEITQFLLERGALNIRDYQRKVTPLMRAALFGEVGLVEIFEDYCSDLEWIEAKELLSTSFSGCISRIENSNKSIQNLAEAFTLRLAKNLPKQIMVEPLELLHHRRECETLEQLNQLLTSNTKDALRIEAILIQQRLLGTDQNDYHDVIHHYGASLAHHHCYHDCLQWWFYEFNLKQKHDMIYPNAYLDHFMTLFEKMKFNDYKSIIIDDVLQMFKIMDYVLQSHKYKTNFDNNLITLLHLITVVARIMYSENSKEKPNVSADSGRNLYKAVKQTIRHEYKTTDSGSSILHLCANSSTDNISFLDNYPCQMTTRLLIDCNADVNALDYDGNTPLHTLIQSTFSVNALKTLDLLCNAGAHLDYANNKRQTPLQSVPSSRIGILELLKRKMNVSRLKCCCSRLIRQQKLPFNQILSAALTDFVQKH